MVRKILEDIITDTIKKLNYDYKASVIKSNRPELCDFQCDDAFKLAKLYHKNPIDIGNEIVNALNNNQDCKEYFKNIEFVKPGFINMTLSDSFINKSISKMNDEERFGIESPDEIKTFILDYGGPNIAKPLHVGHMRTAIVGESIKRIINYMGHKTISDVHLGDYGLQIGQVIYGILNDCIQKDDINIEYLQKIYPKISSMCKEDEEVLKKCAQITKQLQEGNSLYNELWQKILDISGDDIKRLYRYLDVSFDLWQGESDAYKYISAVKDILEAGNLLEDSEGAKIVRINEDDDKLEMPPLIFQKSNGAYLYGTTDLATIYEREKRFKPDYILYIVDNRQSLHFNQVFRVSKKCNLTKANLEFLGYGTINGMDGKPYKTRSGEAPSLEMLFNEVKDIFLAKKESNDQMEDEDIKKIVNSILKFADLQNNRDRDYIFDLNKFSNVVGKTGPYMQYTCVRINKIIKDEEIKNNLSINIYNKIDRDLRIKILELPDALKLAFEERMPSYLVDYIYNLAVITNTFYQNNHINGLDDTIKKNDWLYILNLTNNILNSMLNLIMIDIPKFM